MLDDLHILFIVLLIDRFLYVDIIGFLFSSQIISPPINYIYSDIAHLIQKLQINHSRELQRSYVSESEFITKK